MKIKVLTQIIFIFVFSAVPCFSQDIKDLKEYLIFNGPQNYFPANGEYKKFPDVCNEHTCFEIVSVYYVAENMHGMRRLAVFASSGSYLGCYSGFSESPLGVHGNKLHFQKSEFGDTETLCLSKGICHQNPYGLMVRCINSKRRYNPSLQQDHHQGGKGLADWYSTLSWHLPSSALD